MKKTFLYIILIIFCQVLFAKDKDKILSVKAMQADVDFYFKSLQDIHPNCYIYLTESQFQLTIDSIKALINKPMTKQEFYVLLSSVNKFMDLHTQILPSQKMYNQLDMSYKLPQFYMKDKNVFVSPTLNKEYKIVKINGIDIDTIINFYLQRRNLVEINDNYNFLDIFRMYRNHYFWNEDITITYIDDNVNYQTFNIKPYKDKTVNKKNRVYDFRYDSVQSIGIFELNTFMPKTIRQQFRIFKQINDIFDTLKSKKINTLYIDLTCNNGGLIYIEEYLLNFLLNDNQSRTLWTLTTKQSEQRRKQRGNYPNIVNGTFSSQKHIFTPSYKNNKFLGNVFVIQSRNSFSAASTFASHLQKFRQTKIIGEECQIKAVYTDPIFLQLPHSKFRFYCASGFIKNVGKDKQRGVIPDIPQKIYDIYESISIEQALQMTN